MFKFFKGQEIQLSVLMCNSYIDDNRDSGRRYMFLNIYSAKV